MGFHDSFDVGVPWTHVEVCDVKKVCPIGGSVPLFHQSPLQKHERLLPRLFARGLGFRVIGKYAILYPRAPLSTG